MRHLVGKVMSGIRDTGKVRVIQHPDRWATSTAALWLSRKRSSPKTTKLSLTQVEFLAAVLYIFCET